MKKYYHGSDVIKGEFLQVPLVLLQSQKYANISSDAVLLYGLLSRRLKLSIKNGWLDENNRVYQYYSREEMAKDLRISTKTAQKAVRQLIDTELLQEFQREFGKSNCLYLLQPDIDFIEEAFSNEEEGNFQRLDARPSCDLQTGKIYRSGRKNFPSKREYKSKKYSCNSPSSAPHREETMMKVREQISYTAFASEYLDLVDSIVVIITDTLLFTRKTVRIGHVYKDTAEVQKLLKKTNKATVEHIIQAVRSAGVISNLQSYILTVMYNDLTLPQYPKQSKRQQVAKTGFCDFEQRDTDYDALMAQLRGEGI